MKANISYHLSIFSFDLDTVNLYNTPTNTIIYNTDDHMFGKILPSQVKLLQKNDELLLYK